MQKILLKFKCPKNYDLHMVCHTHGWTNLAPFNWDDSNRCLSFAVYIDSESIDISVFQRNFYIEAFTSSNFKINKTSRERLKAVIIRSLALEVDTTELLLQAEKVGSKYADLVKQGAGRLLRAPTLWEDAAKTLFTTNCSYNNCRCARQLYREEYLLPGDWALAGFLSIQLLRPVWPQACLAFFRAGCRNAADNHHRLGSTV